MSLQFRSTTQREPTTQTPTTQHQPTRPQLQQREPAGITSMNDKSQNTNNSMAYNAREETMRRNPPNSADNSLSRARKVRAQRSFDNLSTTSNTPSVGSGSDIGGRGRPPPTTNPANTVQPPVVRRPTVFYPGTRLASSRQTYNVRRRSQSQGMSTDDLLDIRRHRASHNPDSDSEYSSSELSTSTQATTVASDDESLSGHGKPSNGNGKASQRPGAQTSRQQLTREPDVQYLSPRGSGHLDPEARPFHPETRGSSVQFSPRESTVQFSEPLESSVRFVTNPRDSNGQLSRQPPPRPSRDAPPVPQAPRPDRRSDDNHKSSGRAHSETRKVALPLPVPTPVEAPVVRRARAEDILLDKIEQLKEETDSFQLQQSKASKDLEDTLVRLTNLQVDKEAAERISNQEKELREGLAQELDEQERVIEELEQTVNETVRQLQKTTHQLADAQNELQERDGLALELAELKAQFTEASKVLVDVQNEREELKKALDEAQYQAGRLQKEMEQMSDEKKAQETYFVTRISTLETEKETLGIRVETMQTTQKTHEMQFSDLVKENGTLKGETEKLEEQVKTVIAEKAGVEEANQGLKTVVEGLEEDKKGLRSQVEGLEEDKTGLQTQVEGLEGEKKELQDQITGLEEEKTNLNTRIEGLEGEKKDLEARVETLNAEIEGLNTNVQGVSGEKDELKTQLEALEAEKTELQKDLEKDLEDMEAEIDDLKAQVESLNAEKEELKTQIDTTGGDKAKLEEQVKELEGQIEEAKSKHDTLDLAHAAQITLSGALTHERDTLKTKTTDQEAEMEMLKETSTSAKSDLDSLTQKTTDLEAENQQLKAAQADLPPDVASLQQAVTDKETQITSLQEETRAKIAALTAEKSELEAKVTDLEAKLAELTQTAGQVPGLLEQNNNITNQLNAANAQIADLVAQLTAAAEQVNEYKDATQLSNGELMKLQRAVAQLKTRLESRPASRKKTSVKIKQEDLVLVRSSDKTTFQVVKKTDIRPSRSSSATRSGSDSS